MKKLLLALICVSQLAVGQTVNRTIIFNSNLEQSPTAPQVSWKRGESIKIVVSAFWQNNMVVVTNASTFKLFASTNNNPSVSFYPTLLGTRVDRGTVSWQINSIDNALPAGTYDLEGRAYDAAETNQIVLCNVKLKVEEAAGAGSPAFAGPFRAKYAIASNPLSVFFIDSQTNVQQVAIGPNGYQLISQNGTGITWVAGSAVDVSSRADSNLTWVAINTTSNAISSRIDSNTVMALIGSGSVDTNQVNSLINASTNVQSKQSIANTITLSNNLGGLISLRADSNLIWAALNNVSNTVLAYVQADQVTQSNNLMTQISLRIDSNIVMSLIGAIVPGISESTANGLINASTNLNARADSNTVWAALTTINGTISLRADSNTIWSALNNVSNTLSTLIGAKADSNITWEVMNNTSNWLAALISSGGSGTNAAVKTGINAFLGTNTFTGLTTVRTPLFGWNGSIAAGVTNSAVLSGEGSYVGSAYSLVCGGNNNDVSSYGSSTHNSIVGGGNNLVNVGSVYCIIGAGYNNSIIPVSGTVGPTRAGIFSGDSNKIEGPADYSTILGGSANRVYSANVASQFRYNTIVGGANNTATNAWGATIIGLNSRVYLSTNVTTVGAACVISNAVNAMAIGNGAVVTNSKAIFVTSEGTISGPAMTGQVAIAGGAGVTIGSGTNIPNGNTLRVGGTLQIANAFAGVFTGGVCIVTLPAAQPDATYVPMCNYFDNAATLPISVSNLTTTSFTAYGDASKAFLGVAIDRQ